MAGLPFQNCLPQKQMYKNTFWFLYYGVIRHFESFYFLLKDAFNPQNVKGKGRSLLGVWRLLFKVVRRSENMKPFCL